MRRIRSAALGASLLALLSACATGGGSTPTPATTAATPPATASATPEPPKPAIRIGSADFYEAEIMAQIYGGALAANGYPVEYKLKLGARPVIQSALEGGQIDLLPEYGGSALVFLKGSPTGDPQENARLLQAAYDAAGKKMTVLSASPAQDQNAFVVRQDTADQYGLKTLSDLSAVAKDLVFGGPPECETNPVCAPGLKSVYGIEFKEIKKVDACSADAVTFLVNKEVDVVELCSTQPDIANGLVRLEDDKQLQPADAITPIVRTEWLNAAPAGFRTIIDQVSATMTTDQLFGLGLKFVNDKQDTADIAAAWLADHGFAP